MISFNSRPEGETAREVWDWFVETCADTPVRLVLKTPCRTDALWVATFRSGGRFTVSAKDFSKGGKKG